MIGESVLRLEDQPLLRGEGRFVADINLLHQLHMRIVRSHAAHGTIESIDAAEALDVPGVVAVWTGADVADIPPIDFRQVGADQMVPYRQPILAQDRVRYVGEPVAAVFATDPYIAEDGAEAVVVEVSELAPVLDAAGALGDFDGRLDTEAYVFTEQTGDVDAAFARAGHVLEAEFSVGRHTGVPLECRGAVAVHHRNTRTLEFLGAAKVPFQNRDALARMLGLPPSGVVLREAHVGGGFGVRGELYPEDVLVALAALRLGRPVKWIEDRQEHLVAANHSRDQRYRLRVATDVSGVVEGLEVEFISDQGAYVRTHGATVATLAAAMLPGPYRIPNYRVTGRVRLSNKTPAGTYRAPGRYESTFVRERAMDAIAAELGIDRAEIRRRNLIGSEEMPFERGVDALGTPVVYDSGQYEMMLDRVMGHIDYRALVASLAERRANGELVGLGLGFFVEKSGLGPFAGSRIEVDPSGSVTVTTGEASVGQGFETVMAQICTEVLSVELDTVSVVHGQTDQMSYGMGAFASRATVMAGTATHAAGVALRRRAIEVAAEMLEASPEDLELVDGAVRVVGSPTRAVSLGAVASALGPASPHVQDRPGLVAEEWYTTSHMNYPYGLHAGVVVLDPDTGSVGIERYVIAYDIGRAINPMLVEGQIVGGAAQGLGGALFEDFGYDEIGQPLVTTFMDYLMPTAAEMPDLEILLSEDAPSPLNPLGVKGAGEGGTNACGAVIAAAVDDALGRPGAVTSLPLTPERLHTLCRSGGGSS